MAERNAAEAVATRQVFERLTAKSCRRGLRVFQRAAVNDGLSRRGEDELLMDWRVRSGVTGGDVASSWYSISEICGGREHQ